MSLFGFTSNLAKQIDPKIRTLHAICGLVTEPPDKIIFKAIETIEATDSNANISGIEVIIEKEVDGALRVTQERILLDERNWYMTK